MHVDMFLTTYVCNLSPPERLDRFDWFFFTFVLVTVRIQQQKISDPVSGLSGNADE